jgi:Rhs element Vgr protein
MTKVLQQRDGLVSLKIKIEGVGVTDIVQVQEVFIDMEINSVTAATVVIQERGPHGDVFENSDGDLFIPGKGIEISLGYDDQLETTFKGVVVAQRLRVKNNLSQLIVSCKDRAYGLTEGRSNAIFQNKKDTDAIQSIVGKYPGISLKVEDSEITIPAIMQYNCTDWDFVVMRAEANNMMVTTHQNTMHIETFDAGKQANFEINTAQFITDIDLKLTGEEMVSGIDLIAWDAKEQQQKSVNVQVSEASSQGNLSVKNIAAAMGKGAAAVYSSASLTEEEMALLGTSMLRKTVMAKIEGSMTMFGTTGILAGDMIELTGLSHRFNGKACVTRVQHRLKDGDWLTTLYVGAPKKFHASTSDIMSPPASGILPGATGIQIAKVAKIFGDPADDYRILITLPSFTGTGQSEGLWARLAVPYASKEAGFFFFPEVGDEVLVTFINNDPRFPVITGSLYNAKNIPKEVPSEGNRYKSIVSKSGIHIRFDDEDKILAIETPEGNSIVLDDTAKSILLKDIHSNILTLNDSGMSLESGKDIKLSANGDILLNAIGKIDLDARDDLNGEGNNVNFKAKTEFKAEGNASAELSASGNTTVKGSMVQIN